VVVEGVVELERGAAYPADLAKRVMDGEIFVARGCMQEAGVFEEMQAASLEGVRRFGDDALAENVEREGFDAIHEFADLATIARIADGTYSLLEKKCLGWLSKIVPEILRFDTPFYFERLPNVRYVVPYDLMMKEASVVDRFEADHGGGKIAPHPCHRDSWVDCPDNLINIWIAVGPIPEGNGLALYPKAFGTDLRHLASGSIAYDEAPGEPTTFDLQPGDAIIFQGDQLHCSVLNRTDRTRHAVSFRVVTERPHYPNGHYHRYALSSMAGGALDPLAELPANLAWSWLRTRLDWATDKLAPMKPAEPDPALDERSGTRLGCRESLDLASVPLGALHPLTDDICLARLGEDQVVAFDRRCPHGGADLAKGTISSGEIVCPWHNLRFDPVSGASACESLRRLRRYETRVRDGRVTVSIDEPIAPKSERSA
jgi:nitrite reductase/ring-hydroxylating ferredoxin subunit